MSQKPELAEQSYCVQYRPGDGKNQPQFGVFEAIFWARQFSIFSAGQSGRPPAVFFPLWPRGARPDWAPRAPPRLGQEFFLLNPARDWGELGFGERGGGNRGRNLPR